VTAANATRFTNIPKAMNPIKKAATPSSRVLLNHAKIIAAPASRVLLNHAKIIAAPAAIPAITPKRA